MYGNVELNEDEIAFLKNPPDYSLHGSIEKEKVRVEIEVGLAKVRLSRRSTGYGEEEEGKCESKEEVKEKVDSNKEDKEFEMEEARSRMTYNYESKTIDFGRKRPTDCRNSRDINLPVSRSIVEEAEQMIRKEKWTEIIDKYRMKNCDEKGNQKESNLSKSETKGMNSIIKRVRNNEIVVQISDKCKRLCVSSLEAYEKQGEEHISGCKEINEDEIEAINDKLNGTSKAVANFFRVGVDGPEEGAKRIWSNLTAESCTVPAMRISPK